MEQLDRPWQGPAAAGVLRALKDFAAQSPGPKEVLAKCIVHKRMEHTPGPLIARFLESFSTINEGTSAHFLPDKRCARREDERRGRRGVGGRRWGEATAATQLAASSTPGMPPGTEVVDWSGCTIDYPRGIEIALDLSKGWPVDAFRQLGAGFARGDDTEVETRMLTVRMFRSPNAAAQAKAGGTSLPSES